MTGDAEGGAVVPTLPSDDEVREQLSRRDKAMLLYIIEHADANDLELKETRGWVLTHIARILADPRTPRRLRFKAATWLGDRTDPAPKQLDDAPQRPVNIAVVLQSPERHAELSSSGLAIHLAGHDGLPDERNGRVRHAGGRQDLGGGGDHAGARPAAP
jgi:hypothetical protein